MAAAKVTAMVLLLATVMMVMAGDQVGVLVASAVETCYGDCMRHCTELEVVTIERCETQCDKACREIGEPGMLAESPAAPAAGVDGA